MMKIWQDLANRLKTRKKLLAALAAADFIISSGIVELAKQYSEIRQDRAYMIVVAPDDSPEVGKALLAVWNQVDEIIHWTLPPLVVINRPVEEVSKPSLEYMVKARGGEITWR